MLSSDVTAAFDPLYADVYDKKSSAKLGDGIMFSKYNGGRGKSGGADANPEFIAYIRNIMKFHKCKYQFDSMGKVDQGGGGTIASMVADLNINVLDAGVPVLNMHSPMELAHVNDIYAAYEAYTAFIKE
jgi:aspartyl aminopeptidase